MSIKTIFHLFVLYFTIIFRNLKIIVKKSHIFDQNKFLQLDISYQSLSLGRLTAPQTLKWPWRIEGYLENITLNLCLQVLNLEAMDKSRHWKIVGCSAYTGEGLLEGFDWLVQDVASRIYMLDQFMSKPFHCRRLLHPKEDI